MTVTDQPHDAAGAVMAGAPALLVLPPAIEYVTFTHRTATWTLYAIAAVRRPHRGHRDCSSRSSTLSPTPLGLDSARPETYDIADRTFPGYTLTFTTEH